ncbi:cadherin-like domain-containing protein [Vibrio lentus]|uniref:cadherin-like domain-containing protein n=1 Tax=Vibrio lentus TaxID=136468 RepID=UPI001D039753|nr:cadherin-like domain-containing protein [Vibrio lentus]MCB5461066.1 hypothetical protein [Vibrio lentus]
MTFKHDGSETTSASFDVNVEDGNEDGSTPVDSTFNLTVTPVNDAPELTGDLSAEVDEAGSYTITAADLGYTDVDDTDTGVTFTVSNASNGTILVNGVASSSFTVAQLAAGEVTFKHDGSETTSASFDVNVEDGNEDGSTPVDSTFNLTVTPVNDAPELTGDLSAEVDEAGSYTITAADLGYTDVDDTDTGVTFTVSNASNGTILVNGVASSSFTVAQLAAGEVTFKHDGSETTSASFDVNVEDGNEDGSTPVDSTFNLTVTPVNDAPELTGDLSAEVDEAGSYTITAADLGYTDVDDTDTGVTFTVSNASNGTILVNGVASSSFTVAQLAAGEVTFKHDGSETTSASFDVNVEDGNEDGSTPVDSTFNLTVTPVNDAPELTGDLSAEVDEAGSYTITAADLGYTDVDDTDTGVTFTVSNASNGTILVNGVASSSFTVAQLAAGEVTFKHDGSETTSASFDVNVEDGNEDGSTPVDSTFNLTVTPVNDAPELTGDLSAEVDEAGSYTITAADLGYTDVDDTDTGVTFTVSNASNGTILVNGVASSSFTVAQLAAGEVTFKHDGSETTSASFDVNVEDGNEDGSTPVDSTFNLTVTPVNDAPELTGDLSAEVDEAGSYTITAADLGYTDVDDTDTGVTFTVSNASNGTILVNGVASSSFTVAQLAAGEVTFKHDGSETTSASFDVNVEDGNEDGSTPVDSTFNLTVTPVNDAPELTGDLSAEVDEAGSYTITAADLGYTDVDDTDTGVTFTVSNASNGTILVNGVASSSFTVAQLAAGEVTFKHDGSETTSASFDVNVEDGNEDGSTPVDSTFNLTVTPVNDAPELTGDLSAEVDEAGSYTITAADLGYTDVDDTDTGVTFTVSNASNGTILVNGVASSSFTVAQLAAGEVTFKHDGSETTSASFDVNVEDGNEDGSTPVDSTFNLTVTPVNDAPEAEDFTETTIDCVTSVDFAPHTSDEEDDAAGVETSVIVESVPIFGTLYEVADDGTKTEVVIGQEYGDADNFEYVVDSDIAEQLSFSASDLASEIDTSNGSTSISYFNDLISISAGKYTGSSPVGNDVVSNPGVYLNYDGYRVEDGFGVSTSKSGQSELDVTSKEFISVDFGNSGAEILSANLEFGSVFGNYNANSSADGEINVVALDASGNVVGTFNFNTENTSNSGNEYTLSIDGNGNSIVNVSIPDGNGGFIPFTELRVFTTQDGSANPNRNSNITFKGVDVVDAKVTETIDYKAEDSTDLESTSAQVTIVTDSIVKPSPEVTSVSRDVSEDSDSVQTVSGNIEVLYADSIVLEEPSESYTSAGQNITWSSSNGGQTLIGSANGLAIITAIIDDVGNYSVTLNWPVDHLDSNIPLDEMSIAIGVVASNEAGTQTGSISLTIDDDVPVAQPIINDLQPSAKAGANVQLILDVSGSMAWDSVTGSSSVIDESRLSIMQDAAKQLLAEYQSLGVTQVQIVTFSGSSNAQNGASGTSWMSVTEALDLINNLTADGATYYDSAIDAAMDHWTDVGKVDGNPSNITYFLSDGAPNSGGALTDSEKSSWESFVESNDITALAYGMGEAVPISYLEDIAYNGATDSEIGAVVVPDITQLPPIILQSVVDPISGEVVNDGSNGSISGFGADGGYVSEVKYGGTTVSYDGSTVSVSGLESGVSTAIDGSEISIFIDNSHTLVLDMATGSYQFFAAVVDNDISLDFDYELSDLDGDTSNSSMTFNIQAPVLDANDDVTSTIELVPVLIDVLANDYNPHALTSALILSSVALVNPALGQVSIVDGKVLFVPNDSASAGDIVEISYTATDKNGNSDTATMSVTMTGHSGNIISDGVGINAVYMPQGTVSSNHGDDWQNQPEPSITVNGIKVERGQQNPSLTDAADLIVTGGDNDHVEGGDFDDIIHLGDSGSNAAFDLQDATEFVELGVDDIYQGNNEDGTLESPYVAPSWADVGQGGAGNDVILGESGIDLISGGSGNDYLDGGSENDYIRAGSGNDIVIGGSGDDHLRGEDGNDILIGGLGDDILTGDDGDDLFQWVDQPFQGDVDTIIDFALGEDHLDISQLLPTENNMSDLLEHIAIEKVDNGGGDKDLVITISEGANNSGQTQTIVLDNTGNQFDSVNAQGDGSVISSDLSNLVNQLFVNLPDQ